MDFMCDLEPFSKIQSQIVDLFFKIYGHFPQNSGPFIKKVDLLFERAVRPHLPHPPWLQA